MTRTLNVGVDVDGPLHVFERGLWATLGHFGHHPVDQPMPPVTSWSIVEAFDLVSSDEFHRVCHDGVNAGLLFCGFPTEHAGDALRRIKAAGHRIHIKTARDYGHPGVAEALTHRFLDEIDAPYDTLLITRDKTAGEPCDVFVEDKPSNFAALWAAGTPTYLVDLPWNGDVPAGRWRVPHIGAFADEVLAWPTCPRCRRTVTTGCACGMTFAEKARGLAIHPGEFRAAR